MGRSACDRRDETEVCFRTLLDRDGDIFAEKTADLPRYGLARY